VGSTDICALLDVLRIHGIVSGLLRSIHEDGILQPLNQCVSYFALMQFAIAHRFRDGQVSICCCWYRRMWIDLGETIALVLSSEVVDIVLVVICFHFV
jgi:N-acetylglutamate synthase-like GNAT family acetyltransferase